jgi:autotransporter-associated beta strand protein
MTSKDPLRSRIFTCRGKNLLSLLLAFFSVFSESLSQAQQLAFPGAQGYGQYATGGRGGTVYHVTSLADDGSAGTFRQAVSQGNRTIVFDVGGYIVLNSAVSCAGGITIAGQTAPGGGIGVMNNEVSFYNDNNIICRFFRVRQGGSSTGSSGINIGSGNISTNMIFDHVSVEFGQWDNIDAVHTAYATVQNSIIADPIHQQFGAHVEGYNLTWYGNIWANEHNRQPLCKADTIFINNVVYDYAAAYTTGDTGASHNHDIINNYFITGPSSTAPQDDFFQMNGTPQNLYFTGNLLDSDNNGILGGGTTTPSPDNNGRSGNILSAPWSPVTPTIPTFPTVTAYHMDVTQAGALPRDPLDAQVVSQVMSLGGSGSIMTSPANTGLPNGGYGTIDGGTALVDSDQDGMPDVWESATGSNPLVADNNVVAADGYTLLEHYLNWLAAPHAFIQTNATDIDLWPYTLGFTNGATYSVSGASNGTVTITNLHFAHFVPNSGYTGLAGFNFSVTAGDGSSMTNTMGLLVSIVYVPKNLVWRGDGSANVWDTTNTPNWFNGNDLVTFNTTDSVTFDDTGSANPAVNITAAVSPSSVAFNSTQNYTLGGTGGISGTCKLTKTGTGTLTVSNANTFTGGTLFQGGAIVIGGGGSIGTGPITFQNNTLTCTAGPTANFTLGNTLNIPTGTTNNLYISARASFGPATNGGTLNVIVPGTVDQYDYVQGGWTPFTGTLNITGSVPNALLDLHFNGGNFDGGWGTTILNLNSVTLVGHHNSGGNTLNIGALNGTASSVLAGSEYAGPESWKIGGLNIDCTFAGSISNYTGTTNVLTKIGTGNLTLSGTNTLFGAMVVSNGTLTVSGSISNCLVTVANGSTVRGTGFFGGGLAIQAGGNVLPGILNGQAGTITVSNGLTLASPNLFFDLSSSPAGANDYIAMQGGSLAMSGVNNYIFYPINGYYGAGTYDLIDGATTSTAWSGVTDNLPGNTRQTFNLFRAVAGSNPSYVRLSVTGSASSLVWQGTNGNNWDNVTTNWLNGSSSDKYYNLDLVQFDDTSTNGNVNIVGVIQPATVVVTNSALNYTFGGGVLAGFTGITKNGPGMLTLNSSNSFSGGCLVNGGTLQLVTNVYAGGTGPITLNGGTLFLNGVGTPTTVSCVGSNMLQTYGQPYAGFGLQGSGQLNLNIGGGGVFSPYGDWSKFSGTINFTTGAWMRQLAAPVFGSSNAFWNFGPGGGIYNKYGGCTVYLGAVYGGASTEMGGATTATASLTTYVIGGVNSNSVFNGAITDGGAAATALVYNGPGSLTLTGSNTFSGTTTVNGGALYINNTTGSGTGSGQVNLNGGATLGGSGTISGVVIAIGGGILVPGNNGYGTLTVSNDVSLDSASVLQFTLGTNSSQVFVSGNLTLGGTVNIVKSGGFGPGTYTLFNYGGALSISTLNLGTTPAGYTCVLDTTSVQGQVNLVVSLPSFNNPVAGPAGLVMSGSGGNSNATYYLLGSTNIATPVSNWTRLLTNHFDGSGNFSLTNPIDPNTPQSFYLLQLQ